MRTVPIRADVVAFLRGTGTLDGCWFGDEPPAGKGTFWWRTYLIEPADRAAAIAESIAEDKFVPMDTAPRDGTEVVLRVKLRAGMPGCMLVGHYMRGGHCIEDHPPIDAGWYFWNGCMFDRAAEPIGWAPVPKGDPT